MKKLRWLTALCVMMLSASSAFASGVDVKVKGQWDFAFNWVGHGDFTDHKRYGDTEDDRFSALQRIRTQVNFIASEYLQGVLMFEIGDIDWGRDEGKLGQGSGGGLDADGVNVETKRAYLDWIVPNTDLSLRMGIQGIDLPMANGWDNPVFSADVAGIVANYQINDMFGLAAFWARPFDAYRKGSNSTGKHLSDEMDMFGLILPISGESWSVTPWGVYSRIGNASGYFDYILGEGDEVSFGGDDSNHTHAWWAGVSTELSILDPLTFSLDAMYGRLSKQEVGLWDNVNNVSLGEGQLGTDGWFVAAALNYKLDWATPGLYGWYGSGDKSDSVETGRYGRMPVVGVDNGFAATSFGFPGTTSIGADTAISCTGMGTWGIAAQLADMSFIEDLSHTLRVAYYRGTNDSDLVRNNGGSTDLIPGLAAESIYLTDKDYAIEVNFDHTYQIYENLTAVLELGYINLNLDKDVWEEHKTKDAWKAQLLFQYSF